MWLVHYVCRGGARARLVYEINYAARERGWDSLCRVGCAGIGCGGGELVCVVHFM